MAGRKSTPVRTYKAPKEIPDGMELVDVKRTVGESKGVVLQMLVPVAGANSGLGVSVGTAFLSQILEGEDMGPTFVAEATRTAWINSVVAQLISQKDDADLSTAGSIVPRIAALGVVDKGLVAGARLTAYIQEHGTPPPADKMAEIYAGLSL
ncbi:MAG: hypothetical protein V3T23_01645 [Nitrososphaerales archaeon]